MGHWLACPVRTADCLRSLPHGPGGHWKCSRALSALGDELEEYAEGAVCCPSHVLACIFDLPVEFDAQRATLVRSARELKVNNCGLTTWRSRHIDNASCLWR